MKHTLVSLWQLAMCSPKGRWRDWLGPSTAAATRLDGGSKGGLSVTERPFLIIERVQKKWATLRTSGSPVSMSKHHDDPEEHSPPPCAGADAGAGAGASAGAGVGASAAGCLRWMCLARFLCVPRSQLQTEHVVDVAEDMGGVPWSWIAASSDCRCFGCSILYTTVARAASGCITSDCNV